MKGPSSPRSVDTVVGDAQNLKTADIVPLSTHPMEFREWAEIARTPPGRRPQNPVDEFYAEHHIIDAVMASMEREARRLSVHGELRFECWERIVDFIGNYVYQCYRRKVEFGLFPAIKNLLDPHQSNDPTEFILSAYQNVGQQTINIFEGVSDGDWEKVLRASHVYLAICREHITVQENQILRPLASRLDRAQLAELRKTLNEIEKTSLGDLTRAYYLEVAEKTCSATGITALEPRQPTVDIV